MMIWRLLASVLVVSDQGQRQRQTIKQEQAMNDSKNKTDTLRFPGMDGITIDHVTDRASITARTGAAASRHHRDTE